MSKTINISELKKIIAEVKVEHQWHDKFVKNFTDVRSGTREVLSEEQLDSMAEHLFELFFSTKELDF